MSRSKRPRRPDRWWKGSKRAWSAKAKREVLNAVRNDNLDAVPVVIQRPHQVGWP